MADHTVLTTPNTEALNRPLVSPGDKGEPAHEWASSTLQALSPAASKAHLADSDEPQAQTSHADPTTTTTSTAFTNADAPSTATTPGVSIPGAFPREEELLETSSKTGSSSIGEEAQYVKDVAASALETAKEYVLSTTEQVGSRVGELLHENVAPYLPPSLHPPHDTNANANAKSTTSPSIDTAPNPDDVTLEGVPTPPSPEVPSQQSKSETMREGMGSGNPGSPLSAPSSSHTGKDGAASVGGASADASIRSLAGSKAVGGDRKSVDTNTNTVNESDSYSFTAAPSVVDHPELKAENVSQSPPSSSSNPGTSADEQDRPDLPHHTNETRHIPPVSDSNSRSGSGAPMPNVNARDYPVGTVDARHVGFTHKDKDNSLGVGSSISNVATPGHGDADRDAAKGAAPFMPPGVPHPSNSKEQDLLRGTGTTSTSHSDDTDRNKGKTTPAPTPHDDALSRAGTHPVTASSGISAADLGLAQAGVAPAMAGGAGMASAAAAVSSPSASEGSRPPVPPKDYEGQNNEEFARGESAKATVTGTGAGTGTAKPTTDVEHKTDVPSQPAAGRAPQSQSQSQSSSKSGSGSGNGAGNGGNATATGKTKSGFMDKLKGEMKVLTGKLEHKQEKVEEGRKMMGKGPVGSRN
ncbi:hypothetical protein CVT26_010836 [Gymnopilus dilepis]|uniref:CsbD-like domain-containing protein n=1 Tax=Gymnopilus dilepis TaxID=231916 RepID=A0A409VXY7_9AGAR|nr:hypothetical protein CVT26_010836 [Gymnopilus dilepis]